jgi:NADPH:quinone reductase-like Zn-dependent oxidoreductase
VRRARGSNRGRRGKIAALQQLGVWRAIDRHGEDFVDVILAATGERGVDVVLDNVGASTWHAISAC